MSRDRQLDPTGDAVRHAPTLLICAVEASADQLGADLIRAMRRRRPEIRILGCGGAAMESEGVKSLFPIDSFSVIGPVDTLRALPTAIKAAAKLADAAHHERVDAAIFIDAWSFSRLAAKRMRRVVPDVQLYKYVAPQAWASRERRAQTLQTLFDGALTLFKFETEWFANRGVSTTWVGHAGFQKAMETRGDAEAFRNRHGLVGKQFLAVLPGSRAGEVNRLAPIFSDVIENLSSRLPNLEIVAMPAPGVSSLARELLSRCSAPIRFIEQNEKAELFAASDAALAASGTVSTELAIYQTPMVIAYKIHPMSAWWARQVLTINYASIINIAADEMVIPEFIQENCRPLQIADTLYELLTDATVRQRQLNAFPQILAAELGSVTAPASDLAADTLLQWIEKKAPNSR